jgi:MerR family transcriptional regulator, thiopeptide resistance regulator
VSDRRWSIGELARASGVTVRTLHYYDQIGLVSPGERTGAGHRRYVEADVRRLYRVRALSGLGLSLEQVATVLRGSMEDLDSLRDLLAAQLADLELRADRIEESAHRVRALLDRLAGSAMPEPEQFLSTLVPLSVDVGRYLTDVQREGLAEHAAAMGAGAVEALRTEWVELLTRLRQHLLDGTPAEDETVMALAARWQEIADAFGTHDRHLETAVTAFWRENQAEIGEQLDRRMGWPGPVGTVDIVAYLKRARAAHGKTTGTGKG